MAERTLRAARFVAAQLAVVVAVAHLTLGVLNWARWLQAGFLLPRDLRWPLFVVSGLAVVAGVVAAARGAPRRPLYAAGIGLMLVYVLGYYGWHLGGHRPLFVIGEGVPHEVDLVPFLVDHLFAGPVVFLSLVSEASLALVLAYLLYAEPREATG